MATRHSSEKTFLGEPESVLAREWLEAYHGGREHGDKIPWDFKNRVKLPTNKQVRLRVVYTMRSHTVFNRPGVAGAVVQGGSFNWTPPNFLNTKSLYNC